MNPEERLAHGARFPYDAPDSWWEQSSGGDPPPPQAIDWAHYAARGVLADLGDRRGIKQALEDIDEETRIELTQTLAAIIRASQD